MNRIPTTLRPILSSGSSRPVRCSTFYSLRRSIHGTRPRLASEVPRDPLADPQVQAIFEKIRSHQGALDAMMEIANVMQRKGSSNRSHTAKY